MLYGKYPRPHKPPARRPPSGAASFARNPHHTRSAMRSGLWTAPSRPRTAASSQARCASDNTRAIRKWPRTVGCRAHRRNTSAVAPSPVTQGPSTHHPGRCSRLDEGREIQRVRQPTTRRPEWYSIHFLMRLASPTRLRRPHESSSTITIGEFAMVVCMTTQRPASRI